MKKILGLIFVLMGFMIFTPFSGFAKEPFTIPQLSAFYGKSYKGIQDPEFIFYDQILRIHLVQRIHRSFGIRLDPKTYSGFDLLEIESLFKCKKESEPFDLFLKMFPRYP
ncbi:MAG: hypothetical protein ACPL6D_02665 [Thermodesulfobacteriota bacterium]